MERTKEKLAVLFSIFIYLLAAFCTKLFIFSYISNGISGSSSDIAIGLLLALCTIALLFCSFSNFFSRSLPRYVVVIIYILSVLGFMIEQETFRETLTFITLASKTSLMGYCLWNAFHISLFLIVKGENNKKN